MTKRLIKATTVLLVFALLIVAALFAGIYFGTAQAAVPSVADADIADTYFTGETLTPPEASVSYGGQTVTTSDTTLVYPSGRARSAASYPLDEAGEYTLLYTAEIGGVPVEESRTFIAVQHLYEVSGTGSRAYYGTPSDPNVADRPGVVVELERGDTFTFNKPIDFGSMTSASALIQMYCVPSVINTADALQVIFTFTDTQNPDNYLTITAQQADVADTPSYDWARNSTYTRAGAAFQAQSGWEGSRLHSGDTWGTPSTFSLYGDCANGQTYATQAYYLWFDYTSKTLYTGANMTEVVRFDDPAVFSQFWNGFENGTAYLSITCGSYNSSSTTLVFTNIANIDLTQGDTEEVRDTQAPAIDIDLPAEIPQAVVGQPYRLFDAAVSDDEDSDPDFSCRVWYGYGSSLASEFDVIDGAFTPDRAGDYVIEYSAKDNFGNVATQTVTVRAAARSEALAVTLTGNAQAGLSGENVQVRGYEVSGTIGEWNVAVTASLQGSDVVYDVTDGVFLAEYAGTYTVTYTLSDYISSVSESYDLTVEAGNIVRITEVPALPDYLIAGCTYDLSGAVAYAYASGSPVETAVTFSSTDEQATISGSLFTPATEGEITVTFSAGTAESVSVTATVVEVGYGDSVHMENYFYGASITSSASSSSVAVQASQDASFTFINPVDAGFSITAAVDPERNAFGILRMTFTDPEDAACGFTLDIFRNEEGANAIVEIDGNTAGSFSGSWYGNEGAPISFTISYNTSTKMLSIGSLTVDLSVAPYSFGGFASGRVSIGGAFAEVSGEAGIFVSSINNQSLNSRDYDIANPQITLLGAMSRSFAPGDVVTVVPAIATDVLDPHVSFTVTVTDPSNAIVTSQSGVALDGVDPGMQYTFVVDRLGTYSVLWEAEDGSGLSQSSYFTISVTDNQAPEIRYVNGSVRTGSVGQTIPVAEIEVTDDFTDDVVYYVYLTRPDGVMIPLYTMAETVTYYNGFIPDVAGAWTVTYYAADDAGNAAIVSYTVNVM